MNPNIQNFDQKSVEGKFSWLFLNAEDRTLPSLCLPQLMREWWVPTLVRGNYLSLTMVERTMFQHLLPQPRRVLQANADSVVLGISTRVTGWW